MILHIIKTIFICGTLLLLLILGLTVKDMTADVERLKVQVRALEGRTNALVRVSRAAVEIVSDLDAWVENHRNEHKQILSRKERYENEKKSGGDHTGATGKHAVPKKSIN